MVVRKILFYLNLSILVVPGPIVKLKKISNQPINNQPINNHHRPKLPNINNQRLNNHKPNNYLLKPNKKQTKI